MKNLIRTVVVMMSLVVIISGTAFASTLSQLIVSGCDVYYRQPVLYKDAVNTYLERVPDDVIELFKQQGGSINYTDSTLVGLQDVIGIYFFESKQIYLRVTSANNSWDEVQKAPVHELGHFIYHTTFPMFTNQMKAELNKLYNERKSFDKRCYNEDETFAALYSDFIKFDYRSGAHAMPNLEYRVFIEAEELCKQQGLQYD